MGGNRDFFNFSGISGNWTIVYDVPRPGMGIGTKLWEWEGMGTRKSFPHISATKQ